MALTEAERKMVEKMTWFTLQHPGHKPWEKLVAESRKQVLLANQTAE
jgi:hypothetical protein